MYIIVKAQNFVPTKLCDFTELQSETHTYICICTCSTKETDLILLLLIMQSYNSDLVILSSGEDCFSNFEDLTLPSKLIVPFKNLAPFYLYPKIVMFDII